VKIIKEKYNFIIEKHRQLLQNAKGIKKSLLSSQFSTSFSASSSPSSNSIFSKDLSFSGNDNIYPFLLKPLMYVLECLGNCISGFRCVHIWFLFFYRAICSIWSLCTLQRFITATVIRSVCNSCGNFHKQKRLFSFSTYIILCFLLLTFIVLSKTSNSGNVFLGFII
jgi:hypothetical protein